MVRWFALGAFVGGVVAPAMWPHVERSISSGSHDRNGDYDADHIAIEVGFLRVNVQWWLHR